MASISEILGRLTLLPRVKLVYSLTPDRNLDNRLFIILLDKNKSTESQDPTSQLKDVFQEDNSLLYRVFPFEYALQQLMDHNLFFVHGCLWRHLVYSSSIENIGLFYKYTVNQGQLDKMLMDFNKEMGKVKYWMEGVDYFLENDSLLPPIGLLHQIVTMLFCKVELFLMGKACISHSLQEHQSNIKTFVPELSFLFSTEDEQKTTLLGILDEAYFAKTYGDNHFLDRIQLQKIRECTARMYTLVSKLFSDKIAQCRSNIGKQLPHLETPFKLGHTPSNQILDTGDGILRGKIKELTQKHFNTLQRYPSRKELYCVNLIAEGYLDMSLMISNLIRVCIIALGTENSPTRAVPEPAQNIREVLGYILDLIPYGEMEFLDELQHLLSET